MTLHHSPDDPPRVCWACVDDMVNAPDEPMEEHDPEIAGEDEDGPYCVCGHHVEEVPDEPADGHYCPCDGECLQCHPVPAIEPCAVCRPDPIDPAFAAAFDETYRR